MESKIIISLNLANCKTLGELHLRIKSAFNFPDFYGANWDAFWDLLNQPREYTLVKVIGLNTLPDKLQESGRVLLQILEDNKKDFAKHNWEFEYEVVDGNGE